MSERKIYINCEKSESRCESMCMPKMVVTINIVISKSFSFECSPVCCAVLSRLWRKVKRGSTDAPGRTANPPTAPSPGPPALLSPLDPNPPTGPQGENQDPEAEKGKVLVSELERMWLFTLRVCRRRERHHRRSRSPRERRDKERKRSQSRSRYVH